MLSKLIMTSGLVKIKHLNLQTSPVDYKPAHLKLFFRLLLIIYSPCSSLVHSIYEHICMEVRGDSQNETAKKGNFFLE